jgi:hypothetical protein
MPPSAPSPWRRSVVLAAALFALSACASGPTITTGTDALPGASTVIATPPPAIPGGESCSNLSPTAHDRHGLEAHGTMRDGQPLSALFDGVQRLARGRATKTYLRLPGSRVLRVTLVGPGDRLVRGTRLRPGLPPYGWDRPGDPWVGTLTFPRSGCWRIYVDRDGYDGDIYVHVG